jgi:hypothetical protein
MAPVLSGERGEKHHMNKEHSFHPTQVSHLLQLHLQSLLPNWQKMNMATCYHILLGIDKVQLNRYWWYVSNLFSICQQICI